VARGPRILITGAGGQIGRALRPLLPDARFAAHEDLDVTDGSAVASAARGHDVIVHLAALTNVDACEVERDRAQRVNAGGTDNVAAAARATDARIVYVSTDFVFSGESTNEYREDDPVGPINVYGDTKLQGERHLDPDVDLIVRTSWVFGEGHNFIRTILAASERGTVSVVDDQRGRPTAAAAVAGGVVYLVRKGASGIVHVAGDGPPCTWADLAELSLSLTGSGHGVERISTAAYVASAARVIAPRPPNSVLALDKARSLDVPLLDWRSSVEDYLRGPQ
jgi:dTDP-4-dehydrorhamnose 3,5-epimerase